MKKIFKPFASFWKSNLFKILLLLLIVFLLLMDFWNLSLFRGTIDFDKMGTVGDWFSNFATIITIAFAAITIRNDKLNSEKDRNLAIKMREDDKKDNVEILSKAVYVWVSGTQDPVTRQIRNYEICFSNKTGTPIFEWKILNSKNEIIADSLVYGPIFPDNQESIEIANLDMQDNISIEYLSFLGKRYIRCGSAIKEI